MRPARSARTAYQRWYAAAGPWGGFVRAVPLVGLARGLAAPAMRIRRPPAPLIAAIELAGTREGWLGRADVLLVLDLPGATGVAVTAALAPQAVRPVLLMLAWPEPGALVPTDDLLRALLHHAPTPDAAGGGEPVQYAVVLGRERFGPASAADLAVRFDNRYELGSSDLPSGARLRAGSIGAVVACRRADAPPARDLADYLSLVERAGIPVRRLVVD